MKKYDVVALGELLIDFTENGMSEQGNYMFEANPGGAPCNVLSMLSNLGRETAFIGKVGDDFLGHYLKKVIKEVGIHADALFFDKEIPTTLAFVHTDADGDRDFSFYRNPGADVMLRENEIPEETIADSRVFHFGSLSLTHPEVRKATKRALQIAKENGCLISFDPNLREPLWNSMEEAKEQIAFGISQCDVLKISDNEIQWFTGEEDFDTGIHMLQEQYSVKFITLSRGKEGSSAYWGKHKVDVASFQKKNTIETTGAGDTFCACILHGILSLESCDLSELPEKTVVDMLTFANAAAKLITTKKGALRVMPRREEIEELIKSR